MEEDDEFGDLYTDVLQPFKSYAVPQPPIDLDLRGSDGAAPISRVPDIEASKAIDRGPSGIDKAIDGVMRGQGDDWDSDSDDDLQIVVNDCSRNGSFGAERSANPDDNEEEEEEEDEDDEEPLVIVTDIVPNQAMDEQLWAEDGLQATVGDGKDAGEAGNASGAGGVSAPPKVGYIAHGYHPFHSQFKYVRQGAAPMPGAAASSAVISSGQVRPPVNTGSVAGRGRADWRPLGMKNPSVAQKGFQQGFGAPWGGITASRGFGVGLDFTLPSHKTIFEVDIDGFEEKPWRYPGVDITDFFNFGLTEESWKDYCKQLEQRRVETTMQSRIRVYASGRTDQGYDPDLPPELAAAAGAQSVPADSSSLVKPDSTQGDSTKGPANVRPPLPPGRLIPVEAGYGERLPSIDTRAPRIRDADSVIEIVCLDSYEDELSAGNGVDQLGKSPPGENLLGDVNSGRPGPGSSRRAPTQYEPGKILHDKRGDETSESADGRCSFPSSSPIVDKDNGSSSAYQNDTGAEASKGSEMEEDRKMSSGFSRSVVQDDDGGESKTERSCESSKAKSGSHREYQNLKDSAEEEVVQDRRHAQPASSRKQLDEITQHQSRKDQDQGQEIEGTRVASKGGRENSFRVEFESSYPYHSYTKGDDFDKRKECDVAGSVWRWKQDDTYNRRSREEGSRKRDRGDDLGSRHRSKIRENETHGKDDHVPSRKHVGDGGMRVPIDKDFVSKQKEKDYSLRNNYEVVDDYVSKRRKDEDYLRRSCSNKNEISHGQRESTSRPKRERDDRLEHQKRDVQKIRADYDDHHSFRHVDEFYVLRDGNERQREHGELDNLKQAHEEGSSVHGREKQASMRSQRGSEDRASRMKDEYRGSDKDLLNNDIARHSKQLKRRENDYEESSSHHRGHKDISVRGDKIVNDEKKMRHEKASDRSGKVSNPSDGQRVQDNKHKESRRKNREHRVGDSMDLGPLRNKQEEQNDSFEELGLKSSHDSRNSRHETAQQSNSARRHKEHASSDDEQQDSRRGRSKLERWTSHKERDCNFSAKSSVPLKFQEMDKCANGGSLEGREATQDSTGKCRDINEEKSASDMAEMKDMGLKPPGGHLDTVEKLKKRSERFKLPMPNENATSTVKKMEAEMLPSAKIEGAADSEVKAERPARKRRWTSS